MAHHPYDVSPTKYASEANHGPSYDGSELSCPSPVQLSTNQRSAPRNLNDVSSLQRARELYKYFHPHEFETSLQDDKTADLLLTSQAQLIATRLGGKCLITFLDNSKGYIVAEADGPSSLGADAGPVETFRLGELFEGVHWTSCRGSDSTENSICRVTVREAFPDHGGPIAFLEVEDLKQDGRFSSIPLVTGPLQLKYYAGTPLFTKAGIAIGALSLVDNKIRGLMSVGDKSFLRDISKNTMKILELTLQSRDQNRSIHMNACMSRFMNSRLCSSLATHHESSSTSAARRNTFHKGASRGQDRLPHGPVKLFKPDEDDCEGTPLSERPLNIDSNIENEVRDREKNAPEDKPQEVNPLSYGADMLHEALGLRSSGVLILDTMSLTSASPTTGPIGTSDHPRSMDLPDDSVSPVHAEQKSKSSSGTSFADAVTFTFQSGGPCPILASSINYESETAWKRSGPDSGRPPSASAFFASLSIETMTDLLERYPAGHMWAYDSNGEVCNGDASISTATHYQITRDGEMLLKHVAKASCLVMKPMWNERLDREVVAFVYSTSQYDVFTAELDLPFIDAFCNCVTVELMRLATIAADKQKSDFIGTISHELRSPLHGIVGSCDVLRETELSTNQDALVMQINSCSRTLLDTLSMVLDWSKVNAFERDWKGVRPKRRAGSLPGRKGLDLSQSQLLPRLYDNVDLANVLREVIESSVISHRFQDVQGVDFTDMRPSARGLESDESSDQKRSSRASSREKLHSDPVKVLLNLADPPESWIYLTQPGAYRRMIMNLVGNGLKYTKEGHVKVSLRSESASFVSTTGANDEEDAYDNIILEVEDTGKGISAEWLRTKAFTPFTQEDPLTAGTGLGLSLTRSIVEMLEGTINVSSVVGRGTTIRVSIPMLPQHASTPTTEKEMSSRDWTVTPKSAERGSSIKITFEPTQLAPQINKGGVNVDLTAPKSRPSTSSTLPTTGYPKFSELPFPGPQNAFETTPPRFARRISSIAPTDIGTSAMVNQTICDAAPSTLSNNEGKSDVAAPPQPARSVTEPPLTMSQLTARYARILLVDDNDINLRLLSTYMSKMQYTKVTTACDGRIASDAFKAALDTTTPPHVIFMDLSMPVLDGFDAVREIRLHEHAHKASFPAALTTTPAYIVALTGLASEKDRSRAYEAGVDLYMTKPASYKEISKMMKTWEAGLGASAGDQVPYGAVSGPSATK